MFDWISGVVNESTFREFRACIATITSLINPYQRPWVYLKNEHLNYYTNHTTQSKVENYIERKPGHLL